MGDGFLHICFNVHPVHWEMDPILTKIFVKGVGEKPPLE